MKEELIRVLKNKLNDTVANIDSLNELNSKIDVEKENLSYAQKILELFKEEGNYNVLNFVELDKEEFNKTISILGDDTKKVFDTDSCNYDGLIYLIKGIKNGVSLTLTDEQKKAINQIISGMAGKIEEYSANIDGLNLLKDRFEVSDLDVLNKEKDAVTKVIDACDNHDYIKDIDTLKNAIEFNKLEKDTIIDLLHYVLKYNAELHETKPVVSHVEIKEEKEKVKEEPAHNEPVIPEYEPPKFEAFEEKEELETPKVEETPIEETKVEVAAPFTPEFEEVNVPPVFETPIVPPITEYAEPIQETFEEVKPAEVEIPNFENVEPVVENKVEEVTVDEDFKDLVDNNDYVKEQEHEVETETEVEDTMSTYELQKLLSEYGINSNKVNLNELLSGNIDNYRKVLDTLKKNHLIEEFEKNSHFFAESLIASGEEEINNVLNIIKNDLSIDDEDYDITLRIAINTIPSIFIKDGGNYDNFIKNIALFKQLGINLINLFDFSKEVLLVDNNRMVNNLEIVRKYNVKLDYQNVKYLLVLPDIAERMDYYVESTYPDKTKNNEMFDGITYINNYAAKLNVVTPLTIKRLRYASENGNKVFGSKPNSLSGEITNLKVNTLNITDSYLNNFFNNEFNGLTSDEVREYIKLSRNTSNVGNYSDELDVLEKYHQGLRYVINNINISYNKVIHNYNTLRSYGISREKALHFAVCYNLIITKDEYTNLRNVLGMGGNA